MAAAMGTPCRSLSALAIAGWLLAGCAPDASPPIALSTEATEATEANGTLVGAALRPVGLEHLPPLYDRDLSVSGRTDASPKLASLRLALERNLTWLRGRPQDRLYDYGERQVTAAQLSAALQEVVAWLDAEPSPEVFAARVVQRFDVVESVGGPGTLAGDHGMLVTGYYTPEIEASRSRRPDYQVPIYGPPGGLIRVDLGEWSDDWRGRRIGGILQAGRLVPFPDRAALRGNVLLRGREIAWAKDEVDLFFLEVQGSGTLRFPDGSSRRIGYAGANGRAYRSIGKLLIDEGVIPRERMSMQSLRTWLADHPEHVQRVLDYNQSVVFFRFLDGLPPGNLGFPVTAGRSVAVDQKLLPPGGFGFLVTDLPAATPDGGTVVEGPLTRFVLAQDTGGAIRGAERADFYWGPGAEAAERAGVMKQPGRLFFFVPKL